jgi:hypothetical protein
MTAATSQNRVSGGRSGPAQPKARFWALTLGSIGVVYGDIGTSPLYAVRESVVAAVGSGNPVNETVVLGILSLIIWALILVVTVKYIMILLRADNNGEGGTLALMALAHRAVGPHGAGTVILLGIISGALFYGDAIITPRSLCCLPSKVSRWRRRRSSITSCRSRVLSWLLCSPCSHAGPPGWRPSSDRSHSSGSLRSPSPACGTWRRILPFCMPSIRFTA